MTHLKAGAYVIIVEDTASDHDFHLTGPGVNKTTTVGGKGVFRWNVKLTKGTYTYVCDPHSSFMKGSFTVSYGLYSSSSALDGAVGDRPGARARPRATE